MWSAVLLFCIIALAMTPFTLHQQWHKFSMLRTEGSVQHWYRYRPFLYIVGHAATEVVISSVAMIKVVTPNFQRVVGIDPYLT
eukprot:1544690-Pleurochrysis_carterae.AAC.1